MKSPVKTLHKGVCQEAFDCAGLWNNALFFGASAVSDISDILGVTEMDGGKFSACASALPRIITMSTSDCNLGDQTLHPPKKPIVSLKLTCDLQMPQHQLDSFEKQTCQPSVNGQQHMNKPSSSCYLQESSIPPHWYLSALSLQVEPSVKKASKSPLLNTVQDSYSEKTHGNPDTFQGRENQIPKPSSNDQKRNHIKSCCPQCKESSPEPPVFHLYENPVALTYPRYISCAISQRPDRSEFL